MNNLIRYCKERHIPLHENYQIKYNTYFKTGGMVRVYIQPNTAEDLTILLKYLKSTKCQYKLLGGTTNVLLLDSCHYSVIVSTENVKELRITEDRLEVDTGYYLADLVRVALINGAAGYEGLEGIPGTVGGGIVMNAGAYGYKISDKIIDVTYVDINGDLKVLSKEDCHFDFRTSIFKKVNEKNIIKATFCLAEKCERVDIADLIETFHIARHSYQEWAFPNLGSIYSTKRDMYREILNKNLVQKVVYWFFKLILKNPVSKFINRKKPTNRLFNWLVAQFYVIEYPLSHKSINILINDGLKNDAEIVKHAEKLGLLYGVGTQIENEIYIEQNRLNE